MEKHLREGARGSSLSEESRTAARRPVAIHPSAVVDPRAEIGERVEIGPWAVVGPRARLGARVRVGAHVVLEGELVLEEDVRVWPGAVLGAEPQDKRFAGERSSVRIGARTQVREHVTVHRATGEGAETVVGSDALLMAGCHVGHNCRVGAGATLANGALLAGHVDVAPQAIVSGNSVVHQFVRIGRLAMIGGGSRVNRDVPPFALLVGDSEVRGVNGVGIRRAGLSREEQEEVRRIYQVLYRGSLLLGETLERIDALATTEAGRELVGFLRAPSKRGWCR